VDLSDSEVALSLVTLRDAGYIEVEESLTYGGESGTYTQLLVTGRGMQAIGEWPFFIELTLATLAAGAASAPSAPPAPRYEGSLPALRARAVERRGRTRRALALPRGWRR
jgi:hypothetical protein